MGTNGLKREGALLALSAMTARGHWAERIRKIVDYLSGLTVKNFHSTLTSTSSVAAERKEGVSTSNTVMQSTLPHPFSDTNRWGTLLQNECDRAKKDMNQLLKDNSQVGVII